MSASLTQISAPTPRPIQVDPALACIHCGLCLSVCPTYLETGNENDSPRGRIYLMRALAERRLGLRTGPVRHIDLCLGCRACEAACPSGVEYGELLETSRARVESGYRRSAFQTLLRRGAIERLFPVPGRMRWLLRLARAAAGLRLTPVLPSLMREAMELLPAATPGVELPEYSPVTAGPKRGRVGFLSGCVMSVMFGPTNAATVRLLNRCGYDVITPHGQVCCGALHAHGGNLTKARACARRNLEVFSRLEVVAIITNAAGCGAMLKEMGRLLREDPIWAERARAVSARVRDLSEWLAQHGLQPPASGGANAGTVTFHDACHLAHAQRIARAPRDLVRAVAGQRFVELPEAELCCGSAGTYNLTEPAMAQALQRRKVENIRRTGADVVVTTNPGCILQIQAGLRKAGAGHVQVVHLADYLDQATQPTQDRGVPRSDSKRA